ncbi:MAG: hypothetical protein M5R40_16090 [Anaerolineae bacterium]|nr:hypothetical protein [Anaerolineae bacterium]
MTQFYELSSGDFSIQISHEGRIIQLQYGALERTVNAETRLAGCSVVEPVKSCVRYDGQIEFTKHLVHEPDGTRCVLRETFQSRDSHIRWEVEVRGQGQPWTTPIETIFNWGATDDLLIWTTWGNNAPIDWTVPPFSEFRYNLLNRKAIEPVVPWIDPLVPIPFADLSLAYGGIDKDRRRLGYMADETFSVPIVSVLDRNGEAGFSLVQSPEDLLLDLRLSIGANGEISYTREYHRIALPTQPVRFSLDLVAHEGDWRAGLGWMAERYPQYFEPAVPTVYDLDGGGAYSSYEGDLDVDLYRRMNFRVNWKATFDFPYMGMFLPPVEDGEQWISHNGLPTSIEQLADYSRRMRAQGFYVLGYFNVTEFGRDITFPPPPRKAETDGDLWKDANDYLHNVLADAVLYDAHGERDKHIRSWVGCVAMDCGEPIYQNFLIEQARKHVDLLPDCSGIAIDRMDWTLLYNDRRDDHVSWVNDKAVFSGIVGWHRLLDQIGAIMHRAGKVIYCNPMNRRIDLLEHADGVWDEHGQHAHSLNLCAFLSLYKPFVTWTWQMNEFSGDPDAYIQRHLHLGAQLMVPFPGNDHSVELDEFTRKCYLDYGPLFEGIRRKRWVLRPHVISVEGESAKANIFQVGRDAYVVPVTFGWECDSVTLSIGNLPVPLSRDRSRVELIHPGEDSWMPIRDASMVDEYLRLTVPLQRGCALVRLFINE